MMARNRERVWSAVFCAVFSIIGLGATAQAVPLDLRDPTPRWIEVRFEISPSDQPGQLDEVWSETRVAYLDLVPGRRGIRIRIPAPEFEAHLKTTGTEPIIGSFSEFVWTLDPTTGHVLAAALSGRVRERLTLGPFRTSALVKIRVEMTTLGGGGFREAQSLFGLQTHKFCSPGRDTARCQAVEPVRFDPGSGYVNAVGSVSAATTIGQLRAFSPLGEVQFSERSADGIGAALSGTSIADPVCSSEIDGACPAHLGGES